MKKKTILAVSAAAVILIAALLHLMLLRSQVSDDAGITIRFENNGTVERAAVSEDEAALLRRVLSGHVEHRENYSCGFSPELAISAGDTMFYIASDACAIIYDASTDLFFGITDTDKQSIADVFSKYGGVVNYEPQSRP